MTRLYPRPVQYNNSVGHQIGLALWFYREPGGHYFGIDRQKTHLKGFFSVN